MREELSLSSRTFEYATAGVTLPGESESGDRHLVVATRSGILIAVVDGLGHGPEAAEASRIAVATLDRHAEESVVSLVQHCHEEMKATRGAVMSVAALDEQDHTVTWLGVGNVEGMLVRADRAANAPSENFPMLGGIVGYRLPRLQAMVVPIFARDILIFATDGIRKDFEQELCLDDPLKCNRCPVRGLSGISAKKLCLDYSLKQIAESICAQQSKGTDDALVLVARYLGGSA